MWLLDILLFINIALLVSIVGTIAFILLIAACALGAAILIANRASNCTNEEAHDKIDS